MADRRPRTRLDQPRDPRRRSLDVHYDPEAFGQLTERIARFLGTGRYLVLQTVIIILWLVWNVAAPPSWRFDPYTFTFLTLVLSLQAAYAAPLILLAQNRQDDRDRVNLDEDRDQARQNKADVDYLAREIAAIRVALGEVATRDFLRAELGRFEAGRLEPRDGRGKSDKDKSKSKSSRRASNGSASASASAAEPSAAPSANPSPSPAAQPAADIAGDDPTL